MNPKAVEFIGSHQDLIRENSQESWKEFYSLASFGGKVIDDDPAVGTITEILLAAGLDPAEYLTSLPEGYLCYSSISSYNIPTSIRQLKEGAFWHCYRLESVIIPDRVITIDDHAFWECRSLTSITIPDSVTSIGGGAFCYCSSLTGVTIPDSVTSIGLGAFESCSKLTSVTIGNGVTKIGKGAFWGCDSLEQIFFKGTQAEAIKCGIGRQRRTGWREGSSIERIICTDGEIEF